MGLGNVCLNFEELESRIYFDEDKKLFKEIRICIENELYRSATILIWISVAESLYRKLEILSQNDADILKAKEIYDNSEKDYDLLKQCHKVQLIDDIEYPQLETIRQARNNYAHPNFDSPLKRDVLFYLYYAVEYALSKPDYLSLYNGKNIVNHLLNEPNYLGNVDDDQVKDYAVSLFEKLNNDHLSEILKLLFKLTERMFSEKDPSKNRCIHHGLIYINTLFNIHPELLTEKLCNDFIDKFRFTSCNVFTKESIWELLEERSQYRIFGYSINEDEKIFSKIDFTEIFYKLFENNKLNSQIKEEFNEFFEELSLDILINCNIPANNYFDKIIDGFKSYDFYIQIPSAKIVDKTNLSIFNEEELEILGRNVLQAADGRSWASQDIIEKYEVSNEIPKAFLKGLLFEIFINEKNELRFKGKFFQNILNIINNTGNNELLNELSQEIKQAVPKSLTFGMYDAIIDKLSDFEMETSQSDLLINALKESRCNVINNNVDNLLECDDLKKLADYIPDCLNNKNKVIFFNKAYENPLEFIKYFSIIKLQGFTKHEIKEVKWHLFMPFIDLEKLKDAIINSGIGLDSFDNELAEIVLAKENCDE